MAEPLAKGGHPSLEDFTKLIAKPDYDQAAALADKLSAKFQAGEYSKVVLVYNHFMSLVSQQIRIENFLPLEIQAHDADETEDPFILEPDKDQIIDSILPQVLRLKLYTAIMDSSAAENAARTVAMQTASDNAEDLLSELTLEYNKGRQQKITNEILDLVGGSQQ